MNESRLINQFLVAMPTLADPNFFQSVTYIFQHDAEGAIGIVINKPAHLQTNDLLQQLKMAPCNNLGEAPVLVGGPVQRDRGFVLHQPIGEWETTLHVHGMLAITTSKDILEAISGDRGPAQVAIALGYAGWGPGQLEREISENAWISTPYDPRIIFETPIEQRWQSAAALLGIDMIQISSQAGHA